MPIGSCSTSATRVSCPIAPPARSAAVTNAGVASSVVSGTSTIPLLDRAGPKGNGTAHDITGPASVTGAIVVEPAHGGRGAVALQLALDGSLGPTCRPVDAPGRSAADPADAEATAVPEPAQLPLCLLSRAFDAAPALPCPPLRSAQGLFDVVDHAVDRVARQVSYLVDGLFRPLPSPAHTSSLRPRLRSLGRDA